MTGGVVVILGATGRNLGAGMSGGIAYVLDLEPGKVNPEMVDLDPLSEDDADRLQALLRRHVEETDSERAAELLADWPASAGRFTTVFPKDYKRVLRLRAEAEEKGLDPMVAVMGG
jgi:glutamate synthase (NADPH/NADH) large chain